MTSLLADDKREDKKKSVNNKMTQIGDTPKSSSSGENYSSWSTVVRENDTMRIGFKLIIQ